MSEHSAAASGRSTGSIWCECAAWPAVEDGSAPAHVARPSLIGCPRAPCAVRRAPAMRAHRLRAPSASAGATAQPPCSAAPDRLISRSCPRLRLSTSHPRAARGTASSPSPRVPLSAPVRSLRTHSAALCCASAAAAPARSRRRRALHPPACAAMSHQDAKKNLPKVRVTPCTQPIQHTHAPADPR